MGKQFVLLAGVIFLHFLLFVSAGWTIDRDEIAEYEEETELNDILDFKPKKIEQIFSETKNNSRLLVTHFGLIKDQLDEIQNENHTIADEVKIFGLMSSNYSASETEIRNSLSSLLQYLDNPKNTKLENTLKAQANSLPGNLTILIDGLQVKQNKTYQFDIIDALRLTTQCHVQLLREKLNPFTKTITAGIQVYAEVERQGFVSDSSSFMSFTEYAVNSSVEFSKRLDELRHRCQTNEENVVNDMKRIIYTRLSNATHEDIATTLLQFLEMKYDTKKWLVLVVPRGNIVIGPKVSFTKSGKFRTLMTDNLFAAVISIDRVDAPEFSVQTRAFLKNFGFPVKGFHLIPVTKTVDLYEYFMRYVAPERKNNPETFIETLVVKKTCKGIFDQVEEPVILLSSDNTEFVKISKSVKCVDNLILAVPVRPANWNSKIERDDSSPCYNYNKGKYSFLRNAYSQAYLTMRDETKVVKEPVILDFTWKNTPGQKWHFVDGNLVNNITYCRKSNWLGVSSNCNDFGTHLYRNGMQIVNEKSKTCLAVWKTITGAFKMGQDECDISPKFLWYDWHLACEANQVPFNETQQLRNEFSDNYLSIANDDEYVMHKPWSNQPEQNWSFVDGKLVNSNGKCVIGKSWSVKQADCDDGQNKGAKSWTYNMKRQIISADGYCLAVSNKDNDIYVTYSSCKDAPEYRWWL